jgi:hypothetical protein
MPKEKSFISCSYWKFDAQFTGLISNCRINTTVKMMSQTWQYLAVGIYRHHLTYDVVRSSLGVVTG